MVAAAGNVYWHLHWRRLEVSMKLSTFWKRLIQAARSRYGQENDFSRRIPVLEHSRTRSRIGSISLCRFRFWGKTEPSHHGHLALTASKPRRYFEQLACGAHRIAFLKLCAIFQAQYATMASSRSQARPVMAQSLCDRERPSLPRLRVSARQASLMIRNEVAVLR